jgi:hypothetical protein
MKKVSDSSLDVDAKQMQVGLGCRFCRGKTPRKLQLDAEACWRAPAANNVIDTVYHAASKPFSTFMKSLCMSSNEDWISSF